MSVKAKQARRERRRANRQIQAFYRARISPNAEGISLHVAAKAILRHVGAPIPAKPSTASLRRAALAVVSEPLDFTAPADVPRAPTTAEKADFYASWEWQTLRMKTLKRYGRRCLCCGAAPGEFTVAGEPVRLNVDHIKPISKHWSLRLDPENVQVLCAECNKGKGAWDQTDWREGAA